MAPGPRRPGCCPPLRCSRDALRAVAAECDSLSLRLGATTISVRCTARNPAMPPVPIMSYTGDSLPDRKLAALAAGLRAPANRPPQGAPTPGPTARFKPSRTDPLNREPTATPSTTAPFKPSGIDPLNREPTAKPASTAPFKPSRTDPLNREPPANPGPTAPFKPPLNLIPRRRRPSTAPRAATRPHP